MGHFDYVQDDCENFVHFSFHNEIFWCGDYFHILVVGQMALSPSTSLRGCKFCHAPPLCVIDYNERVYYDVHRLQSISRVAIHLGVHKHYIVDGKCKESMDETKKVNHTLDVNIFAISLSASKTFLGRHLLDVVVMV